MFTSYLTPKNYISLSASYIFDKQIDFLTKRISVDGYLTTSHSPVLSGLNDFIKSNYSLMYVTPQINFDRVTNFSRPQQGSRNYFCNLYNKVSGGGNVYFTFSENVDDSLLNTIIFDQTFDTKLSALNDLNYFNLDITSPFVCTISHTYGNDEFYLAFNPASLNLNFAILSGFTGTTDYNRKFYYTYNPKDQSISLQVRIGGQAYQVIRDSSTTRLTLCTIDSIAYTDTRGIFYLTAFYDPTLPEVTVDWGSYLKSFNQNNITIDINRSFFNVKNNFLLHAEYFNIAKEQAGIATNILPLKTQLNINNLQGRQNVFLNEDPVNYRNYVSMFGGNRQEKGYDKLHLQYETYSYPYSFKAGKTTWFNMPQNMYPYTRLNISTSKLIEAGAVGGDHPLRSDKVFKKLGEYRYTSNQGDTTGETTGQWLCAWLSAGPDITKKPIWVDRYYNPTTSTPFQALEAAESNVTYIPSYTCYNLGLGIVDIPSSLTFEPGCLYAYSHIGTTDALQNIKLLEKNQQHKNFDTYLRYDGLRLDPQKSRELINTYEYDGSKYSTIDVSDFNLDLNNFTISFWASRPDWTKPAGYQVGGNYNEYGLGIFNYKLVNPFLFYLNGSIVTALNRDLEVINKFDNLKTFNQKPQFLLVRDPLNAFHAITDSLTLGEINLQETLVDAVTSMFSVPVKDASNDQENAYILFTNNSLSGVNLASNLPFSITADAIISESGNYNQIKKIGDDIVLIDGNQATVRNTGVYFLSSGIIRRWDTFSKSITSVVGTKSNQIQAFNIDKFNNTWASSGNSITVYGEFQKPLFTVALTADKSFSSIPPKILGITFMDNFISGDLYSDVIVSASGSQANKLIISRLNYSGRQNKTVMIDTDINYNQNLDPSNHGFNYAYIYDKANGNNNYSFKIRLYNQFNTEDIEIPEPTIMVKDLNPGYHHFSIIVNTVNGYIKLYLDGEIYQTVSFTPKKYSFVPLVTDTVIVGTCPFYSGLTLSNFIKRSTLNTYYYVKDLYIQNLYWHNKELNYFDIGMLYKEKIPPTDLIWDAPAGRRNYFETVSRYFTQKIPGAKSMLYNIYLNDNIMDSTCRDYLQAAITKKLKDITPVYTKLNSLKWVTNLPAQSAEYLQPYFAGNTLTNGAFDR